MKTAVRDRRIRRNIWPAWRPKPVTDRIVLQSSLGASLYYLCPGCEIFLPREYMRFCDCCGQRGGWEGILEENDD